MIIERMIEMNLDEVSRHTDVYCKVVGFSYLDSSTMDKEIRGTITISNNRVIVTDEDGFEFEMVPEEIKEIVVL